MNPLIVIPARMASVRLPGKPLANIAGEPMIIHCWRRAMAAAAGPVIVATGDAEIAALVKAAGGEAVMTDPGHPSGSDRVHEALEATDAAGRFDVVVNMQGDLPTLDPGLIAAVLSPLENDPQVDVATLACVMENPDDAQNPDIVKVAAALSPSHERARALYFSRSPIPYGPGPCYHHIGIYAWRRTALQRFVTLPVGMLERREKLEQLRALEAGMRIDVALVESLPVGVDTPDDLRQVRDALGHGRWLEPN